MIYDKIYPTEVTFTPDWHPELSCLLGDIRGEVGYITDYGTIHLLGKRKPEISEFKYKSNTDGATTSITACKTGGIL